MSENHPAKKRGRPRKIREAGPVQESTSVAEPVEALNPEDFTTLKQLNSLPLLSKKFEKELKDPVVHKRFKGNTHLLMGLHELSIYKVAEQAGCSQSTLSRMLNTPPKAFEKVSPLIFVGIAHALGASIHTLLFVDLREKLLKIILEEKGD